MITRAMFVIVGMVVGALALTILSAMVLPIPPVVAACFGIGLIGGGICGSKIYKKLK